jgi:alpha-mannosidase
MKKNRKLYAVSNAHLDTQWNWTIQDTIRDCVKNTLADNFALFEKYPHYRMNFEGAFRYALAKEYYPDLYEKLFERWCDALAAISAEIPFVKGSTSEVYPE